MTGIDERPDSNAAAAFMTDGLPLRDERLLLGLDGCTLALRSNSSALIEELSEYFGAYVIDDGVADIEVLAVERPALDIEESLGVRFVDWAREPGKKGRKDAFVDLTDGRLVRKVRTDLLFLQRDGPVIAAGPCRQHPNQVINFVNAQYMNRLQQQGWLICHAAASTANERAIGLAGFSGGGKSTLMLHLMDQPGFGYLTNDRLFVRRHDEGVRVRGIPKLPRVNPGTIIGNQRLHGLISQAEHDRFAAMSRDQLWELEQKHDVDIDRVYGPGRIAAEAPLAAFVVLNWQRADDREATLEPVELAERGDLLAAIMKSPGPFYQYSDGHFHADDTAFDDAAYLQALRGVPVFEVTGGIDFPRISARVAALLNQPASPDTEAHHDT
jgi:HprK-related kinase B